MQMIFYRWKNSNAIKLSAFCFVTIGMFYKQSLPKNLKNYLSSKIAIFSNLVYSHVILSYVIPEGINKKFKYR